MILARLDGELQVVTQADHAHLAAEILALWRADGLPQHARRDALLFAVREHDNGWREADAAPRIDGASGSPPDFRSIPSALRCEIWQRGIERYAAVRPYAALLIAQHAWSLHCNRRGDDWCVFLERVAARRRELLAACAVSDETLSADYAWLELVDHLSLRACCREPDASAGALRRLRLAFDPGGLARLELEPFPLAGATTFEVPARRIPDRSYTGDTDLAITLANARWTSAAVRVSPLSG